MTFEDAASLVTCLSYPASTPDLAWTLATRDKLLPERMSCRRIQTNGNQYFPNLPDGPDHERRDVRLAAVTKTLGFGVSASTSYLNPYILARTFSSLDHLTNGRVAWNIVTSWAKSAAQSLGFDDVVPHDGAREITTPWIIVY